MSTFGQMYATCSDCGHGTKQNRTPHALGRCHHCPKTSAMPVHIVTGDGDDLVLAHVCKGCKVSKGYIRITINTVGTDGANVAKKFGLHGLFMRGDN